MSAERSGRREVLFHLAGTMQLNPLRVGASDSVGEVLQKVGSW